MWRKPGWHSWDCICGRWSWCGHGCSKCVAWPWLRCRNATDDRSTCSCTRRDCSTSPGVLGKTDLVTRMSWGEFKMAPAKRSKRCDMSTSKFTTIDAFFVNLNKSSVPGIVPEQSESASFATLVEIHNVDAPAACNRDATVLSPNTGTLQWPSVIAVDFEIKSDSGSDSHT